MQTRPQWLGFTWQGPPAINPRLVTAMYYTQPPGGLSGRISHPFWVLDYSRSHCGRVRVGTPMSPWYDRPASVAHLYPPATAYWEDTRTVKDMMEAAYVVFACGDEAGLRDCIPKDHPHARMMDTDGSILAHIHAAAIAGAQRGTDGFWDAQAALCALIQALHRTGIVPAAPAAPSAFVKSVDAFLSGRVGGQVSLAEVAKAVHVSPSTLSHRYAAEAGRPPLSAFNVMRLEVARSLILRGLKLDAVATQTGFCDAYHLSKSFKRHFGMPPGAYRRGLQTGMPIETT